MNKIVNWLGQDMKFEGSLSSAIAKHEITNFPVVIFMMMVYLILQQIQKFL